MSRAHHCEDIVNRGAAGAVRADQALMVATADLPTEWIVIETRNASPPASASAAEEPPKTKKPAATTRVTAGSIDFVRCLFRREPDEAEHDARSTPAEKGHGWLFPRDAEQDARVTQPEKAMDGFSGVKNGRYRTRTYDP